MTRTPFTIIGNGKHISIISENILRWCSCDEQCGRNNDGVADTRSICIGYLDMVEFIWRKKNQIPA
jgi:hypothetical protein